MPESANKPAPTAQRVDHPHSLAEFARWIQYATLQLCIRLGVLPEEEVWHPLRKARWEQAQQLGIPGNLADAPPGFFGEFMKALTETAANARQRAATLEAQRLYGEQHRSA